MHMGKWRKAFDCIIIIFLLYCEPVEGNVGHRPENSFRELSLIHPPEEDGRIFAIMTQVVEECYQTFQCAKICFIAVGILSTYKVREGSINVQAVIIIIIWIVKIIFIYIPLLDC